MNRNEELRQELLEMFQRDQKMRETLFSPEDAARCESIDAANTARIKEIIAEHGWPTQTAVGQDGAMAAWLLVQHADKAPGFQRECLELMQQDAVRGEASHTNLAYLTDRVRFGNDQPQIYGTQCRAADGQIIPFEIKDAAYVDARRVTVGLGPLVEYIASMNTK